MPKMSEDCVQKKQQEIIHACEVLYKTMNFKDITIKEIGSLTSLTRTSIYNYFQTKEEIFLALVQQEYERWIEELRTLMEENRTLSKEKFASALAHSLAHRELLLKLMSMNHYDMETNTRPERLTEFKVVYGESIRTVIMCLEKFVPDMDVLQMQRFVYTFFPFMFGIYPYTFVNEKQRAAMEEANVNYVFMSIYEITLNCVKGLLKIEE